MIITNTNESGKVDNNWPQDQGFIFFYFTAFGKVSKFVQFCATLQRVNFRPYSYCL